MHAIVARENMPTWNRLWDDFIQEEPRIGLAIKSNNMEIMRRMFLSQERERNDPRKDLVMGLDGKVNKINI